MIKNYIASKNIQLIENSNNMPDLMLEADLAIGAGGSTSLERCCLGLPTLIYVLAENQIKIANNLEHLGAVIRVNNLKFDLNFIKSISKNFDAYINNAFSVSHRNHASTVGVTNFLPSLSILLLEEDNS